MSEAANAATEGSALFRSLATGVWALSLQERVASINLPYPATAQLALDRLVLHCAGRQEQYPSSVPELVSWCAERPASKWPFPVPSNLALPTARLVDRITKMRTRTCAELAVDDGVPILDTQADAVMNDLGTEPVGVGKREFLIDHVVIDRSGHRQMLATKPLSAQRFKRLKYLYGPPPDAWVVEGRVYQCSTCGLLALPTKDKQPRTAWCEAETCPRDGLLTASYDASDVHVLRTPLRLLVALPGKAERIALARLRAAGLAVDPVGPVLGTYQLGNGGKPGRRMRVYDRMQPGPLAERALADKVSFVVVPEQLLAMQVGFREGFAAALPAGADIRLVSTSEVATAAQATET
ncbi:hypothetical protein ACQPZF_11030 [Actinosynnema sp. CS-041913]|uniref:pPIWI_RE_Y domain-containing protein n=1 Tax=Actinosynnema sp. CS-041913 TaxID=3239917 RepID=UPI003D8DBE64